MTMPPGDHRNRCACGCLIYHEGRVVRHRGRDVRASKAIAVALVLLLALPVAVDAAGYPARESRYHDYAEMYRAMREIEAEHPGIVRVFRIGRSAQGRSIWAAEVSDDPGEHEGEPEVMFDGLHHAREHLTG